MHLFSFVSAFFFSHHSWSNPWLQYYINSARALFLAAEEVTRVFFSSTLFPAHTFLILILQTASYTHTCWLTLVSGGCGVLRSTRVLHTMLNRPGTRSKRLGPDPDPADHLKYRPEPVRVPGRVSGPPWRPLFRTPATRVRCLCSNQSVNRRIRHIPVSRLIQRSVRILRPGDNLQNGTTLTQRRRYGA